MQQKSRAVLISVHPIYVSKILSGEKRVEFRRVWAAHKVTHLVVYATSPEMKVKAIVEVEDVLKGSKSVLWEVAKEYGGGLTRNELRNYFDGVSRGHAIIFNEIKQLKKFLPLTEAIPGMRAPQSYAYLTNAQFEAIKAMTL
ncbi:ASCH domain-containing protein [uncultured Marinimicrobium sp.]|jgi:predicted transcriptional regulator|uniref:ASCH domain-containing protein n=1 Tax=uncultured Marinimicrobium sp. TaxID=503840 RepID=UPI0030D6F4F6|tara:strand:- start:618 stop:1043 length:426 start_codon:yes stop_codon:yes gene_type:complete